MSKLLLFVVKLLGEFFKKALLPFLAYQQGKKNQELKTTKKLLEKINKENERSHETSRAKSNISSSSDNDVDSVI